MTELQGVRIMNITYLSTIYVTISFLFSYYLNEIVGEFNKEEADAQSTTRLIFEIYLYFALISVASYIIRNIIKRIPFSMDNLFGVHNTKNTEINGGVIFAFAIFYFQKNLKDKINYLFMERLFNKN